MAADGRGTPARRHAQGPAWRAAPSPGLRHARPGSGAGTGRRRWARFGAAFGAALLLPVLALAGLVLLSDPPERHHLAAADQDAVEEREAPRAAGGTVAATVAPPPAREAPALSDADPSAAGPADLIAELARLRAAVAAERARLAVLRQEREALLASLEALRHGAAGGLAAAVAPGAAAVPPAPAEEGRPPAPPRAAEAEGLRIVLHHRAGSASAARAAAQVAAALREAGLETAGTREVPAVPSVRVVRYFHSADAAAAARIAARLGRGWAIQDFRAFNPLPPPQTVEIWLPDR
ncbi:hypothetical protein [Caldovatus sediminis]|nr:hypothetical protein [Caldovatus sediminis]